MSCRALNSFSCIEGVRHRCKKSANLRSSSLRSYAQTWRWYVRGNVVSKYAQKIVIQLMAATCGTSKKRDTNDDDADENSERTPLPKTDVALETVHGILDRMSTADVKKVQRRNVERDKEGEVTDEDVDAKALEQSSQIPESMKLAAKLWSRDALPWSTETPDISTCTIPGLEAASTSAKSKKKTSAKSQFSVRARQSQALHDGGTYFGQISFKIVN